jgi:hypothetical protein
VNNIMISCMKYGCVFMDKISCPYKTIKTTMFH